MSNEKSISGRILAERKPQKVEGLITKVSKAMNDRKSSEECFCITDVVRPSMQPAVRLRRTVVSHDFII